MGMVCAESGKEAVRERVVVMSSPGVQEKGGGRMWDRKSLFSRETSKLGVLITLAS